MADPGEITMHHLKAFVPGYLWPLGHTRVLDVLCVCVCSGWLVVQGYLDLVTGAQGEKKWESKEKRTAQEWRRKEKGWKKESASSVKESKRGRSLAHVIRPKWVFHWLSGLRRCSTGTKIDWRSGSHRVRETGHCCSRMKRGGAVRDAGTVRLLWSRFSRGDALYQFYYGCCFRAVQTKILHLIGHPSYQFRCAELHRRKASHNSLN